jgi:short-subunit dehydrogenase
MNTQPQRVALVTGGSAGLGLVVSRTLRSRGYQVVIVGRDQTRLDQARDQLGDDVIARRCDVTSESDIAELLSNLTRLDVLVNCVGISDRGLIEDLQSDRLQELLDQNVLTALQCSQAALPMLKDSQGVIVNIGSLASKVGARYIGGYTIAKHALAGLTQQLRLELKPAGVHVGLVSPGPIQRDDAGQRYSEVVDDKLPANASAPGGGAKVKGIPPQRVADAVMRCIDKRVPDIVLPGYMRLVISIGHAFPRFGDWLLIKGTSG